MTAGEMMVSRRMVQRTTKNVELNGFFQGDYLGFGFGGGGGLTPVVASSRDWLVGMISGAAGRTPEGNFGIRSTLTFVSGIRGFFDMQVLLLAPEAQASARIVMHVENN